MKINMHIRLFDKLLIATLFIWSNVEVCCQDLSTIELDFPLDLIENQSFVLTLRPLDNGKLKAPIHIIASEDHRTKMILLNQMTKEMQGNVVRRGKQLKSAINSQESSSSSASQNALFGSEAVGKLVKSVMNILKSKSFLESDIGQDFDEGTLNIPLILLPEDGNNDTIFILPQSYADSTFDEASNADVENMSNEDIDVENTTNEDIENEISIELDNKLNRLAINRRIGLMKGMDSEITETLKNSDEDIDNILDSIAELTKSNNIFSDESLKSNESISSDEYLQVIVKASMMVDSDEDAMDLGGLLVDPAVASFKNKLMLSKVNQMDNGIDASEILTRIRNLNDNFQESTENSIFNEDLLKNISKLINNNKQDLSSYSIYISEDLLKNMSELDIDTVQNVNLESIEIPDEFESIEFSDERGTDTTVESDEISSKENEKLIWQLFDNSDEITTLNEVSDDKPIITDTKPFSNQRSKYKYSRKGLRKPYIHDLDQDSIAAKKKNNKDKKKNGIPNSFDEKIISSQINLRKLFGLPKCKSEEKSSEENLRSLELRNQLVLELANQLFFPTPRSLSESRRVHDMKQPTAFGPANETTILKSALQDKSSEETLSSIEFVDKPGVRSSFVEYQGSPNESRRGQNMKQSKRTAHVPIQHKTILKSASHDKSSEENLLNAALDDQSELRSSYLNYQGSPNERRRGRNMQHSTEYGAPHERRIITFPQDMSSEENLSNLEFDNQPSFRSSWVDFQDSSNEHQRGRNIKLSTVYGAPSEKSILVSSRHSSPYSLDNRNDENNNPVYILNRKHISTPVLKETQHRQARKESHPLWMWANS